MKLAWFPRPFHPDPNSWVGKTYVFLMALCLVVILAAGCHGGAQVRIEMAPHTGPLSPGEMVRLALRGPEGEEFPLPADAAWEIDGVLGGSRDYSQITLDGVYRAPLVESPRSFVVRLIRRTSLQGTSEIVATQRVFVFPRASSGKTG